MLIITSKRLKLAQVDTQYKKQHPYLWDAWLNKSDLQTDLVAPGETVPVKAHEPEFEPTSKMVIETKNLYPPLDAEGNKIKTSPFLWKERNQKEPDIVRWIWHPVTGQTVLEASGEYNSHATMIPYDWDKSQAGAPFEEWVRGFWMPRSKRVYIRPYFKPRNPDDKWDEFHAVTNAKIMYRIKKLLQSHLEPVIGPIEIVTNVNNDDVQRVTGLRRV